MDTLDSGSLAIPTSTTSSFADEILVSADEGNQGPSGDTHPQGSMEAFRRSRNHVLDSGSVASTTTSFTDELVVSADEGVQGVMLHLRGLLLGGLARAASLGADNMPKPSGPADAVANASKHKVIHAVYEDGDWSASSNASAPRASSSPSRSPFSTMRLMEEVNSSFLRFRIAWGGASFLLVVVVLHLARIWCRKNGEMSTRLERKPYNELPPTAELESQDPPPEGPAGSAPDQEFTFEGPAG
jgi:hypothetical protein